MIKNSSMALKMLSKHKDRGFTSYFTYYVDGKYGMPQTAKPKSNLRSNCFYLSIPGLPEIKIDNVSNYTMFFHKTAGTLSMSNQTNWIYFSHSHDRIIEKVDFENSYFLITINKKPLQHRSELNRHDVLFYKNMELVYTFHDVERVIVDNYNFSEDRIYLLRKDKETEENSYFVYNGECEKPFWPISLYQKFDELREMMSSGKVWDEIPCGLEAVPFFYLFPNGKVGDVHQFIAKEYGEYISDEGAVIRKTEFETNNLDPLLLLDFYASKSDDLAVKLTTLNKPLIDFIYTYHIPHALHALANEIMLFTLWKDLPDYIKEAIPMESYLFEKKIKTEELYDKIVLSGEVSSKWRSEGMLYNMIKAKYPDAVFQYREKWLGRLSLDIFIPSLKTGVEYQGEQHYHQVDYFGEESYQNYIKRDKKKRKLCEERGIKLIEWRYDQPITEAAVEEFFNIQQM